jgi:DNA-binding NarL/FixJ family response regulator/class 3 adenylate cyclase
VTDAGSHPRTTIRGFLFADLRGYSNYVEARGDLAGVELLTAYRGIVRSVLGRYDGAEVRTEGDSVYVVFPSPSRAVSCAMDIIGRATATEPPIDVGIGIHAGEAAETGEGPVGSAVNIAARVCSHAGAGELLVTDTVRSLTRTLVPFRFVARGTPVLKGITEPLALYRVVEPEDAADPESSPAAGTARRPPDGSRPIRVVLADDAVLLREALAAALVGSGFQVLGQAADVGELMALVQRERPDVAIVDVRMPPTHTTEGLQAARRLRDEHRGIAILVLSQYVETRYAVDLLRDDASGLGYLLKDRVMRLDDLADAVRRVASGGSVIDPEVVQRLLGRPRQHSPLDELTRREREILGLMAEGRSNGGIAERLGVEPKTVENHVGVIFSKLGLEPAAEDHRRVLAVLSYLRGAQ